MEPIGMDKELTVEEQLEKYRTIEDFDVYFRELKMKDITLSDMLLYCAIHGYPDFVKPIDTNDAHKKYT